MKIRDLPWYPIAWLVTRPAVREWLIRRARRTPYTHITRPGDDADLYMGRWWLFNPYGKTSEGRTLPPRYPWLPSIRLHLIARADSAPHEHDHPWQARTIILGGWYDEQRAAEYPGYRRRHEGYTGRLLFGQYHTIPRVSGDGVWTLFFTWRYRGTWGFNVNGTKVPYYEYLK